MEVVQYSGDTLEDIQHIGVYLQYMQGDNISLWRVFSTVVDTFSTVGLTQYYGG